MTLPETVKLLTMIAEIYPRFLDGREIRTTAAIWQKLFADEPYSEVDAALYAFVASDEKGFAPAPGAIRATLNRLRRPEGETTETEAWAMVQKATRNSLYNADAEYAKLPRDVQSSVGSPETLREWAMMDADTLNSVIASNFMRGYRARAVQVREMEKLPSSVKAVFGAFGEALKLGRGSGSPEAEKPPNDPPEPKPEPAYADAGEGWKLARARINQLQRERGQEGMKGST